VLSAVILGDCGLPFSDVSILYIVANQKALSVFVPK